MFEGVVNQNIKANDILDQHMRSIVQHHAVPVVPHRHTFHIVLVSFSSKMDQIALNVKKRQPFNLKCEVSRTAMENSAKVSLRPWKRP